jgi:hypothetical protein
MVSVKLNEECKAQIKANKAKAVSFINCILDSNTGVKTDKADRYKTAMKDLYIIDLLDGNKYFCYRAEIDSWLYEINMYFGERR